MKIEPSNFIDKLIQAETEVKVVYTSDIDRISHVLYGVILSENSKYIFIEGNRFGDTIPIANERIVMLVAFKKKKHHVGLESMRRDGCKKQEPFSYEKWWKKLH